MQSVNDMEAAYREFGTSDDAAAEYWINYRRREARANGGRIALRAYVAACWLRYVEHWGNCRSLKQAGMEVER